MKLLLITAIEEFEKEVKSILKHSGVKSFSYQSVKGYNNHENELENWFSLDDVEINSSLFTIFTESRYVDEIYNRVEVFNSKQKTLSHIHIATVQLEKSI
jgi:nitrogen regulatory protein PII